MQNELKTAIGFNDFVAYFGARGTGYGLVDGAAHAARIRQDQNSFPFLQIVGAAGSGKSLLLEYLQKLNGQTAYVHSVAHATPTGRVRTFAKPGQRVVICEDHGESVQPIDWDELKPFFSSGNVITRTGKDQSEEVTFGGALVITANQMLACSDAVSSRLILVDLSAPDAHIPRVRPDAIGDLDASEASAFGTKVAQSEEWISSHLKTYVPVHGPAIAQRGQRLNTRTALNCAQMLALLDLLCTLLSISEELRLETRKLIYDIAFLDTIPY
ncbi:hypothetical protein THH46_10130 [Pseudomonas sp. NA13]